MSDLLRERADDDIGQRERRKREDVGHGGPETEVEVAERLDVDPPGHHVTGVARPALGQDEEQVEMMIEGCLN